MPRVSVIMPSYNHARYIGEAIESVLAQTLQDFELIIVDDGSTDNSREIIAGYRDRDPRISFLPFEKNRGAYTAINDAMQLARGDYIAHLNSDDRFLPDKLEQQVAFLEANPEYGICFSTVEVIDDAGRPQPDSEYTTLFSRINGSRHEWLGFFFTRNCLCHPTMLARREVMERAGPYDDRYRQQADLDLWIRIAMFTNIFVMGRPTLQFRDHGLNTGGRSLATRHRTAQERRFILERYLAIEDVAEVLRIFPNLKEIIPYPAPGTARYLICLQALLASRPQFAIMAIDTLFRLMADPAQRQLLEKAYGFTLPRLHKIAGETDVYAAKIDTMARLGIIAAGKQAFVEATYTNSDEFDFRFALPRRPGVTGYVLQFMSVPAVLSVSRFVFITGGGGELAVQDWQCNARPPARGGIGTMSFPLYPAQFGIAAGAVPPDAIALRISGRILNSGAAALADYFKSADAAPLQPAAS